MCKNDGGPEGPNENDSHSQLERENANENDYHSHLGHRFYHTLPDLSRFFRKINMVYFRFVYCVLGSFCYTRGMNKKDLKNKIANCKNKRLKFEYIKILHQIEKAELPIS